MKILPVTDEALREALDVLREGGVVAHATETCYGFACDLKNPAAVGKLFAIKQRPAGKPVSGLFPSVEAAKEYVVWNDRASSLASVYLPGPLTIILPQKEPPLLFPTPDPNPNPTLGVRVSSHPLAMALATEFGSPLSTTSANLSTLPNPYSAEDIVGQYKDQDLKPDLILDSGAIPPTPPSTVIDCTKDNPTEVRGGNVKL